MAGGVGAVALAGAGGWLLLKPAPANAKRIAVLPFANLSADQEQAYFSEGVAEELRSALSRIELEVIGRTSSEAVKGLDARAAAAKLGVANILTGSVRRSPETIRINAQLVSGSDGVERWGQSYDRAPGDAIKIQADIAENVAQALSVALGQATRAALTLGGTSDSVAQDLVLQARKLRYEADRPDAIRKVFGLAGAAIARDPNYADAYVEKTIALLLLGGNYSSGPADMARQFAIAEIAAKRALNIAPNLGSAHAALAIVDVGRLDLPSALRSSRRALALSPEDPNVLSGALNTITYLGDGQEALRLADKLIAVDPLNAQSYSLKSDVLFTTRQYLEAIKAGRKTLELAPDLNLVRSTIGNSFILLNKPAEAMAEFRALPADNPYKLTGEAIVSARSRDFAAAERKIARLWQNGGDAASYQYAQIHAQGGNKNGAFAALRKGLEAKDGGLMYTKTDPFLDPIWADPRYAALIRQLNFP
jgi:serine/threonine-protein kinase